MLPLLYRHGLRRHALDAVKTFEAAYGAKFPQAVTKITDDLDELLVLYDYPAEHRIHLRTTNPIATVRRRTKVTRGPGSLRRVTAHPAEPVTGIARQVETPLWKTE